MNHASACAAPALSSRPRGRTGVVGAFMALLDLRRQRRRLLALDARLLRDVGLTRAAALREAARPAWDAPAHWMR